MSETEKFTDDHASLIRHAQILMIEALQLLDAAGAHQSASLLDHAICVLPQAGVVSTPVREQASDSN